MNVSAKSEYGLRALMHLAERRDEGLVPAREIADASGVPVKYLEQILKVLREGGLAEGQVGVGGGYRLTRDPRLIRAGEAVRLLDARLGLGEPESRLSATDPLGALWRAVDEAVASVLDRTTIADLISPRCTSRRLGGAA